jgi:hypothetical protein
MNESARAENVVIPQQTDVSRIDYKLIARMVVREGKTFKASALAGGYSKSIAGRGLRAIMAESAPLADAVKAETNALANTRLLDLKPLAIARLHSEISDIRRPGGLKAIEIAGRFKETDWFVRSVDVQVGVFANFAEGPEIMTDSYQDQLQDSPGDPIP